jgi:hypothetical protein
VKTMEVWHRAGVYNSHELVRLYREETGKVGVYLAPQANDGSRMNMGQPDGVLVLRPGFLTDKGGPWTNHGNKVFDRYAYAYDMAKAMQAAQEWAAGEYCVGPEFGAIVGFGRDRFPEEIVTWAKQKFKQIQKEES